MKNKINIMNIINVPIWTVYLVWQMYLLVTYLVAMYANPDGHLTLNEDAAFVNWCINLVFVVDLAANAVVNIVKARKAREK